MKKLLTAIALTELSVLACAENLLTNGSFERGNNLPPLNFFRTLQFGNTDIEGWVVTNTTAPFYYFPGSVDWVGAGYWQSTDGLYSVDLSGDYAGGITTTLPTRHGEWYELSFDLAGNPDRGYDKHMRLSFGAGFFVTDFTFKQAGWSKSNMGYERHSVQFFSGHSGVTVTFASLDLDAYGPVIDNVRLHRLPPRRVSSVPIGPMLLGAPVLDARSATGVTYRVLPF